MILFRILVMGSVGDVSTGLASSSAVSTIACTAGSFSVTDNSRKEIAYRKWNKKKYCAGLNLLL